jgi:hypothetical protein
MSKRTQYHLYQDLGDIYVNVDSYNSKIDPTPDANGCLNWSGPWHRQGYGMIGAVRKADDKRIMVVAHRVGARIKAKRALSPADTVVHSCSNPACQNLAHLLIGDLKLRNRIGQANGTMNNPTRKRAGVEYKQNRTYKYTEKEILFLRTATTTQIEKKFGYTNAQACNARWYAKSNFKWLK